MKKALAKGLLVIIEAGIEVLAERIKKRRNKNGNHGGLDHLRRGNGAYDLLDRSAAHSAAVGSQRHLGKGRTHGRFISLELTDTMEGGGSNERTNHFQRR